MQCQVFLDLMKAYDGANDSHHLAVGELIRFVGRVNLAAFAKLERIVKDTGIFATIVLCTVVAWGQDPWFIADPGCDAYGAWQMQGSPRADPTGFRNTAYPEANATYWGSSFELPIGTDMIIRGRFPAARYMAIQLYDTNRNVLDAINDQSINPDPGENNPFRTGTAAGRYQIRVIFGPKPAQPAANTIYTLSTAKVLLVYRVYYPTNPNDLVGGTTDPVLPEIFRDGVFLTPCPVRPIIQPEDNTVWGRIDNADFSGVRPSTVSPATSPPAWTLSVTNPSTPYFPSQDNSYMSAVISRDFMTSPYVNGVVVVRFKTATYANTQAGEPPYLATTTRQVRLWSVCSNERRSTGVVRCIADYQVPLRDGFATIVISDPSKKPTDTVLAQHSAVWLPWGALLPGDSVYDVEGNSLNNNSGAFYQGFIIYRQTMSNPSWTQSFTNIGKLPKSLWKSAMGEYWPVAGYCTSNAFNQKGSGCVVPRR